MITDILVAHPWMSPAALAILVVVGPPDCLSDTIGASIGALLASASIRLHRRS